MLHAVPKGARALLYKVSRRFSFAHRLHRREEFEFALQKRGLSARWMTLHFRKNAAGIERLGMIVSKRVALKAITRNRIKRLIREIFRQGARVDGSGSLDFVVKMRRNPESQEIKEFKQSLSCLLDEARRIKDHDTPNSASH